MKFDRPKLLDQPIPARDADAEAAWDELADRRERELQAGTVEAVPWNVAMARLEARFHE